MIGFQRLLLSLALLIAVGIGAPIPPDAHVDIIPEVVVPSLASGLGSSNTANIERKLSQNGTTSVNTLSRPAKRRIMRHFSIIFNRYDDFECGRKSLDRHNPDDSRGVELEINDFHDGIATSDCFFWADMTPFNSFEYNWMNHIFHTENLEEFGQCRLFLYQDDSCNTGADWTDWANTTPNMQGCTIVREGPALSVRTECRRGDAEWGSTPEDRKISSRGREKKHRLDVELYT